MLVRGDGHEVGVVLGPSAAVGCCIRLLPADVVSGAETGGVTRRRQLPEHTHTHTVYVMTHQSFRLVHVTDAAVNRDSW